jgi:hypothetical protein
VCGQAAFFAAVGRAAPKPVIADGRTKPTNVTTRAGWVRYEGLVGTVATGRGAWRLVRLAIVGVSGFGRVEEVALILVAAGRSRHRRAASPHLVK